MLYCLNIFLTFLDETSFEGVTQVKASKAKTDCIKKGTKAALSDAAYRLRPVSHWVFCAQSETGISNGSGTCLIRMTSQGQLCYSCKLPSRPFCCLVYFMSPRLTRNINVSKFDVFQQKMPRYIFFTRYFLYLLLLLNETDVMNLSASLPDKIFNFRKIHASQRRSLKRTNVNYLCSKLVVMKQYV